MSEKAPRKSPLNLHFWIAEAEVYGRNGIQVEWAGANPCCEWSTADGTGFIRWREGDSSEELRQRRYRSVEELCRPRQVRTDHRVAVSRRRGVGHGGR
jgi:hypothetical protein